MAKSDRKKFGMAKQPLVATRILSMPMEYFQNQGMDAHSLLVINDVAGTFTSANVYDGNLGKNYDPTEITHPLPSKADERWKEWAKRGYLFGKTDAQGDATFGGVVTLIGQTEEVEVEDAEDDAEEVEVDAEEVEVDAE